jgi:hypothetical protein
MGESNQGSTDMEKDGELDSGKLAEMHARIEDWALEFIKSAHSFSLVDPVCATNSLIVAAGRLIALSGSSLEDALKVFKHEYNPRDGADGGSRKYRQYRDPSF